MTKTSNFKKPITLIVLGLATFAFYFYSSKGVSLDSHSVKIKQEGKGMSIEDFQKRVSNKNKIVLVYFYADWCVPCIKLRPDILELENETKAYCEILKIDVDDNPKLGTYFEINTLPMFMIYKNGNKSWENMGSLTRMQLNSKINMFR